MRRTAGEWMHCLGLSKLSAPWWIEWHIEEIATGPSLPTAMFGPDGNLYVSNWGFGPPNMGEIVKIIVQRGAWQFLNMSARAIVQGGDNVLISGFILKGPNNIIIRALFPRPIACKQRVRKERHYRRGFG